MPDKKRVVILDDFIEYEDIYLTPQTSPSTSIIDSGTSKSCCCCCCCCTNPNEVDLWCFKYTSYNSYSMYDDKIDNIIDNYNDNVGGGTGAADNINPMAKKHSKNPLRKVSKVFCCAFFECCECKCWMCPCNAVTECCCVTFSCV
jgi:hypothetical protein